MMRAIEKLELMADLFTGGHYTICKFTTNYRICLGTPLDGDDIRYMKAKGATLEDAVINLELIIEENLKKSDFNAWFYMFSDHEERLIND